VEARKVGSKELASIGITITIRGVRKTSTFSWGDKRRKEKEKYRDVVAEKTFQRKGEGWNL